MLPQKVNVISNVDGDAGTSTIALSILQIVELKIDIFASILHAFLGYLYQTVYKILYWYYLSLSIYISKHDDLHIRLQFCIISGKHSVSMQYISTFVLIVDLILLTTFVITSWGMQIRFSTIRVILKLRQHFC